MVDQLSAFADEVTRVALMVANLRETTRTNREQDWLNTNLAGPET